MRRENELLFHLSPEGRGRANEVSEGEGVRKLGIFLVRPSPLTPPSPLRGEGVHDRCANRKRRKQQCQHDVAKNHLTVPTRRNG